MIIDLRDSFIESVPLFPFKEALKPIGTHAFPDKCPMGRLETIGILKSLNLS